MTFNARDDYYFNNRNDALSSDSRPISTTTYGISTNNFDAQPNIYDQYGNANNQAYDETQQRPATVMSTDAYAYYNLPATGDQRCSNNSVNENVTYNQDDYGPYDALDEYDGALDGGGYWTSINTTCNGESGRYTSMSGYGNPAKVLPTLPIKHSSSMLDGMYVGVSKSQRFGACLPTTPPVTVVDNNKSRMLPQAVAYQNVQQCAGSAYTNYNHKLNGHAGYATGNGVSATVGNGKCLPAMPTRMLPQARQTTLQRQIFEDAINTSSNGDLYTNQSTFDNATINNYNYNMMLTRPHTSMLPLDYSDDSYNGYNGDNLSTYSDTPPTANPAKQQKLQQQRKQSLMMAMTTASVIASGETRIPLQKKPQQLLRQRQQQQQQLLLSGNISSSSGVIGYNAADSIRDSYTFEYDSSGVATPKTNVLTAHISTAGAGAGAGAATANAVDVVNDISTNTTASSTAAEKFSQVPQPTATPRKLPKRLPTPQYKATTSTTTTALPLSIVSSPNGRAHPKQLPKLPTQQHKTLPNIESKSLVPSTSDITTFTSESNLLSPPPSAQITTSSNRVLDTTTMPSNSTKPSLQSMTSNANVDNLSFTGTHITTVHLSSEENKEELSSSNSSRNSNNNSSAPTKDIYSFLNQKLSPSPSSTPPPMPPSTVASISISSENSSIATIAPLVLSSSLTTYSTSSGIFSTVTTNSNTLVDSTFDIAEYLKPYSLTSSYLLPLDESAKGHVTTCISDDLLTYTTTNTNTKSNTNSKAELSESYISTENESYFSSKPFSFTPALSSLYTATTAAASATVVTTASSEVLTSTTTTLAVTDTKLVSAVNSTVHSDYSSSLTEILGNSYLPMISSFPPDIVTTTQDCKPSELINVSCQVAETITTSCDVLANNTATSPTPSMVTSEVSITSPSSMSYADYMKKFELPELPPLTVMTSCEQVNNKELEAVPTTLPSYITDFMNSDYKLPTLEDFSLYNEKETDSIITVVTESNANTSNENYTSPITTLSKSMTPTAAIETESIRPLLPEIATTSTTSVITTAVDTMSSAFDDSFYDSFNVDLSMLTACVTTTAPETSALTLAQNDNYNTATDVHTYTLPTITASFSTPLPTHKTDESYAVSSTALEQNEPDIKSASGTQGGYYKPPSKTTSKESSPASASPLSLTPQKAAATAASAAGKATSVLGGLSKGLKGGLDGVLSGVSASVNDQTKQSSSQNKKGFGFGLASKLVPSVGGLLSSKQTPITTATTTAATSLNQEFNMQRTTEYNMIVTTSNNGAQGYGYEYTSATTTATPTPTNENAMFTHDAGLNGVDMKTNNYNYDDHFYSDGMIAVDDTSVVGYDDEYGYNEYADYHSLGEVNAEISYSYDDQLLHMNTDVVATTAGHTSVVSDAALMLSQGNVDVPLKVAPIELSAKDKTTAESSLLSTVTLTNIVNAPSNASTKKFSVGGSSGGGGMFGSFLGKAAAAVQTATNVVNQGASIASSVVQKVPIPHDQQATVPSSTIPNATIAVSDPNRVVTMVTGSSHASDITTIGCDLSLHNDYNNQLLLNQNSLSSQYSTTGDDYENSNMLAYTTASQMVNDNKTYVNYYSNGNQSQLTQEQIESSMLPTVPPAGSTGKKLPTINGKLGYLIKQQPTEIFDDDDEFIDEISGERLGCLDPNYHIDSEQDDYYLDQQQTTPSVRTTVANGYYEHANSGYDYREDYFNEEDEYKYLEKEEQQKIEEEEFLLLQQKEQQQQMLLKQHQKTLQQAKLSSLDYVDDMHDDYIDENYQSEEDSGNYLDESSSGSVGAGKRLSSKLHSKETTPTSLTTPALTDVANQNTIAPMQAHLVAHQQIKKQDSIIMEEEESELAIRSSNSEILSPEQQDIKHTLSRKSSILDEEDEDDQLPDLRTTMRASQKRKALTRGETEEVVSHMHMIRKPEVTAKQRWHWAYNKIIIQLNVSIISLSYIYYN